MQVWVWRVTSFQLQQRKRLRSGNVTLSWSYHSFEYHHTHETKCSNNLGHCRFNFLGSLRPFLLQLQLPCSSNINTIARNSLPQEF